MQSDNKTPAKINKNKVLRKNGKKGPRKTAIRFKTLCDIRRFLARTVNDLDAGEIAEGKARTLGYLCGVLRDVVKDSELEVRVKKLEEEVKKNESA